MPIEDSRCGRSRQHERRRPRREAGYNLVIMVMAITVVNVMVAVALPVWSHAIKRDREEELIFRGLQYAEAIRVFQLRYGRYPTQLEELLKVRPRCIRQLWEDPMSDSGEWGLLVGGAQQVAGSRGEVAGRSPGAQGRAGLKSDPGPLQVGVGGLEGSTRIRQQKPGNLVPIPPGGKGSRVVGAQIQGVFSATQEPAVRSFLDRNQYDQWHFTVSLIRMPSVVAGDRPPPRATSEWIGRPFRGNIKPPGGVPPRQPVKQQP